MTYSRSTWWCDCGKKMTIDYESSSANEIVLECCKAPRSGCGKVIFQSIFNPGDGIPLSGASFARILELAKENKHESWT